MESKRHAIVMSINTDISIVMANYASLDTKILFIIQSSETRKKKKMPRKRLLVNLNLASYNALLADSNISNTI